MLALLGALREEITGIRKLMTVAEVIDRPDFKLYRGKYQDKDCLLVQTGMGKQRVETAIRFILERFRVSAMVSFGFAGALASELRAGDIVICSTLRYGNGRVRDGREPKSLSSDASLLELTTRALESGGVKFCSGSSMTVAQPLSNRESKEKLYRISQAYIADMESYWVAMIAAKEGVPFVAIRAVSDTSRQGLPPFDRILAEDGRWLWRNAFAYFVLHPQDLLRLPGLYSGSRKARKSLTECIARIIAGMDQPGELR